MIAPQFDAEDNRLTQTADATPRSGLWYRAGTWLPFLVGCLLVWRNIDFWREIAGYGDVLELIWGLEWYALQLRRGAFLPVYDGIFHPLGWHVGAFAHPPLLFLLGQPFRWIGGAAFALNVLTLLSFGVAYAGGLRFFGTLAAQPLVTVAFSFAYTFASTRMWRMQGHLHTLWLTALLPWLAVAVWRAAARPTWRSFAWVGLLWGVAINFSLYALFFVPLLFLLYGRAWPQRELWAGLVVTLGVAALVAAPAVGLYLATPALLREAGSIDALVRWSAQPGTLWSLSVIHPLAAVRGVAADFASLNETVMLNYGSVTLLLAAVGVVRARTARRPLLLLAIVGTLLALGPLVVVEGRSFAPLMAWLWQAGAWLKPELFEGPLPAAWRDALPLPYLPALIVLPYLESARTVVRFGYVAWLALLGLAALGLHKLPTWLLLLLLCAVVLEALPIAPQGQPIDFAQLHPAHAWLKAQPRADGEGSIDLDHGLLYGASNLYTSLQTGVPTASPAVSFVPAPTAALYDAIGRQGITAETAALLAMYDVRYVLVHQVNAGAAQRWAEILALPAFRPIQCFDPPAVPGPHDYPICVAELASPAFLNGVQLVYGWSAPEAWGVWAIDRQPRLYFLATQPGDHTLTIEAFPNCVDGMTQAMRVLVNNQFVADVRWAACETQRLTIALPAAGITPGVNEITLQMRYAVVPEGDPRTLAVGFNLIAVDAQP